ncbi:MAG TPA: hypothetical protein VJ208_02870 [Candidatus Nanoarchaeia archaeon]|nr:hypothetical protein [Candidatus Nanoarchaeia archaeon]
MADKRRIKISAEYGRAELSLLLDRRIVQKYGGISEVKRILESYLCHIMGDLCVPEFKYGMDLVNAEASRLKKMVLEGKLILPKPKLD